MKNITLVILALFIAQNCAIQAQETKELDELVIIAGKKKHKKLFGTGMKISGGVTSFTPDKTGYEVGSIIKTRHPFEVEEIKFDVITNSIEGAILGVEIYSIESGFTKRLPQPLLTKIPKGEKQDISIVPEKRIILEPGEYFIAIHFVDCDEDSKRASSESQQNYKEREKILLPLYIKNSYIRNGSSENLEKSKINVGLKVKGIEYK